MVLNPAEDLSLWGTDLQGRFRTTGYIDDHWPTPPFEKQKTSTLSHSHHRIWLINDTQTLDLNASEDVNLRGMRRTLNANSLRRSTTHLSIHPWKNPWSMRYFAHCSSQKPLIDEGPHRVSQQNAPRASGSCWVPSDLHQFPIFVLKLRYRLLFTSTHMSITHRMA